MCPVLMAVATLARRDTQVICVRVALLPRRQLPIAVDEQERMERRRATVLALQQFIPRAAQRLKGNLRAVGLSHAQVRMQQLSHDAPPRAVQSQGQRRSPGFVGRVRCQKVLARRPGRLQLRHRHDGRLVQVGVLGGGLAALLLLAMLLALHVRLAHLLQESIHPGVARRPRERRCWILRNARPQQREQRPAEGAVAGAEGHHHLGKVAAGVAEATAALSHHLLAPQPVSRRLRRLQHLLGAGDRGRAARVLGGQSVVFDANVVDAQQDGGAGTHAAHQRKLGEGRALCVGLGGERELLRLLPRHDVQEHGLLVAPGIRDVGQEVVHQHILEHWGEDVDVDGSVAVARVLRLGVVPVALRRVQVPAEVRDEVVLHIRLVDGVGFNLFLGAAEHGDRPPALREATAHGDDLKATFHRLSVGLGQAVVLSHAVHALCEDGRRRVDGAERVGVRVPPADPREGLRGLLGQVVAPQVGVAQAAEPLEVPVRDAAAELVEAQVQLLQAPQLAQRLEGHLARQLILRQDELPQLAQLGVLRRDAAVEEVVAQMQPFQGRERRKRRRQRTPQAVVAQVEDHQVLQQKHGVRDLPDESIVRKAQAPEGELTVEDLGRHPPAHVARQVDSIGVGEARREAPRNRLGIAARLRHDSLDGRNGRRIDKRHPDPRLLCLFHDRLPGLAGLRPGLDHLDRVEADFCPETTLRSLELR
eukprot:scaffold1373_cov367-Pinguiococcus_pyrenoidosus.AAC.15